ncbi:hypothetical protein [Propionibacterium freudenreichii]|uniref:hypothetical protein n=1 Tax=Propionibacterium freudenreichii TaxID=1744 RepID=UPI0013B0522E|nr:hypothetical protein [Propionibacterium freudenreichii]
MKSRTVARVVRVALVALCAIIGVVLLVMGRHVLGASAGRRVPGNDRLAESPADR